jgi:outer membrane biosynthesis protein TonB
MKKGKAVPKKANNIKSKVSKPAPVLSRVKTLAKGLVRAMASKPAKKAQAKLPAKAVKPAPKAQPKPQKKPVAAPKPLETKSKKGKAPVATAPKTASKKSGEVQPSPPQPSVKVAPAKSGKGTAPSVTPAPVPAKVKGGKGAKVNANAHNEKLCRETGCDNSATTKGYCRLDYIKNWKKIKRKEMILKEGKLNQYIEELVSKYPQKYIEVIRQDLSSEVNFNKVIHDLELDESMEDLDYDSDSIDSLIGSIRKEDDGIDDSEF